jgi:hypothetical protein
MDQYRDSGMRENLERLAAEDDRGRHSPLVTDKKIRLTEITVSTAKRDSQGVDKSHIFAWTRPPRVMEALR